MWGIINGITDSDYISFCPICSEEISEYYADGTAECEHCKKRFGVVICEENED